MIIISDDLKMMLKEQAEMLIKKEETDRDQVQPDWEVSPSVDGRRCEEMECIVAVSERWKYLCGERRVIIASSELELY